MLLPVELATLSYLVWDEGLFRPSMVFTLRAIVVPPMFRSVPTLLVELSLKGWKPFVLTANTTPALVDDPGVEPGMPEASGLQSD